MEKNELSFIFKVLNNRTSLVHQDTYRAIDYEELIYTTIILKIVFELYLLESICFEIDYLKEIIKKRKIDGITFEYMKNVAKFSKRGKKFIDFYLQWCW